MSTVTINPTQSQTAASMITIPSGTRGSGSEGQTQGQSGGGAPPPGGVGTRSDQPDRLADRSVTEALYGHQELKKPCRLLSPAKHLLTIPYIVYVVID